MFSRRPPADKAVISALESCKSNTRVKRMVMFGLRALSELCTPPRSRYLENALDALGRGVVETLNEIVTNIPDDEETADLVMKVCWGISRGLEEYRDAEEKNRFTNEGGAQVVSTVLVLLGEEPSSLVQCFELIDVLTRLGILIDTQIAATMIVKGLQQTNLPDDVILKIFLTTETIASVREDDAQLFKDAGVDIALLECARNMDRGNEKSKEEIVYHCFKAIKSICKKTQSSTELVVTVKLLMDEHKNQKYIYNLGTEVLQQIVSFEQLETALKDLSSPGDSEMHKNALKFVTAISMIPSFTTHIVESGAIPLLVQGIKHTQAELTEENRDPSIMEGLIGSMNILGSLAKNADYVNQVYEAGGVAAIVGLLNHFKDPSPIEPFAACCCALACVASTDVYAQELVEMYDLITVIINVLYMHAQIGYVREGALEFLEALAAHVSLHSSLIISSTVEVVGYSLQFTSEKVKIAMSALKTLQYLVPYVESIAAFYEYGGFQGFSVCITFYKENKEVCLLAFPLISAFVTISDIKTFNHDGDLVDAVLAAMLEHQMITRITEMGVQILQEIANEGDVERYVESLDSALLNSSTNPQAALSTLAGIYGLSCVEHLSPAFAKKNVPATLLQHFSQVAHQIVKNPNNSRNSTSQTLAPEIRILRAEMLAIECITLAIPAPLGEILTSSFETVMNDQLKPLAQYHEKSMEVFLACLNRMTATKRFKDEATIEKTLASVILGFKLYADHKSLVELLFEILKTLSSLPQASISELFTKTNVHQLILNQLKNKMFSLNIQINGLTILQNLLNNTSQIIPDLKSKGAIDLINADLRTYGRDPVLRGLAVSLLSQLIEPLEMRDYVSRNIEMLRDSFESKDFRATTAALQVLTVPAASPQGNKLLLHLGILNDLNRVQTVNVPDNERMNLISAFTQLMCGMSTFPSDKSNFTDPSLINFLLQCIQDFFDAEDQEGLASSLQCLGNILEGQASSLPVALKKRIVSLVMNVSEAYAFQPVIVSNAARILGQLATTEEDVAILMENPKLESFLEQRIADLTEARDETAVEMATESLSHLLLPSHATLKHMCVERVVPGLLHCLERYPENNRIVKNSAECLHSLGVDCKELRRLFVKFNNQDPTCMRNLCNTFQNCIESSIQHPDNCATLLNALRQFIEPEDSQMLREQKVLADVSRLSELYPEHKPLGDACSDIVKSISSDQLIQFYIQKLMEAEEQDDRRAIDDAIENLNALLLTPVEDPDECLANEEYIWNCLVRRLQSALSEDNLKPIRNCVVLSQRLVNQGKKDVEGYRGPWYFSQYMLPTFLEMIDAGGSPMESNRVIIPMMSTLQATLLNPNTRSFCLEPLVMENVVDLLNPSCLSDPTSTSAVINMLNSLTYDNEGLEKLHSCKRDLVPTLSTVLRCHRGREDIVVPATNLLAECCDVNMKETSRNLITGDALTAAERGTDRTCDDSAMLDTSFMNLVAHAAANPKILPAVLKDDLLSKALERFTGESALKKLPGSSVPDSSDMFLSHQRAMINLLDAYAAAGQGLHVRQKGGTDLLLSMLDDPNTDESLKPLVLMTLVNLSESDPSLAENELLQRVVPELFPWCINDEEANMIQSNDQESTVPKSLLLQGLDAVPNHRLAKSLVKMINAFHDLDQPIGKTNVSAKDFVHLPQTKQLLEELKEILQDDDEALSMLQDLSNISGSKPTDESLNQDFSPPELNEPYRMNNDGVPEHCLVNPNNPDEITLKQIYDWLNERINNNLTVRIDDTSEPLLSEYSTFVLEQLSHYAMLTLRENEFAGYQCQFGCKSWDLWLFYFPDIYDTLIAANAHVLLLQYLLTQTHDAHGPKEKEVAIASAPSETLANIGSVANPPDLLITAVPNIDDLCCRNLQFVLDDPQIHRDEHFIPRLRLVEATAIDRTIYENPRIVEIFNAIWLLCDNGTVTRDCLVHVFRAFRKVLCDNHVNMVLELGMIPRLIQELKKDDNNLLLIHGFFLLGILAVDSQMKDIIGNCGGVEETLTILKNHLNDAPGEGVITNAQLVLANLVVGHRSNCNRFYKFGGLDTNVEVLNERAEHYDEVNGASALITNVCFRRDDMKEAYGLDAVGAPAALAYAISCYDGSTDKTGLRSLTNLFKAISNMSLYTPNVEHFLNSGIEVAYYNLLEQSEGLPDEVVKTGLYTLSNLTWENKSENMQRFGMIMPPLIKTISQSHRQDSVLIGNGLETLASLCRCQDNAEKFAESGGIESTIVLVEMYAENSLYIVTHGVQCLGVLARYPKNAPFFDAQRCLLLLKNVVEGAYFEDNTPSALQEETAVTALRTTRRILSIGQAPWVGLFNQLQYSDTLVWYISSLANMEETLPQLVLESLRLLVGCVFLGEGNDPLTIPTLEECANVYNSRVAVQKSRKWFGRNSLSSEDKSFAETLNDEKPRGYEVAGFNPHRCGEITTLLLTLAQQPSITKSLRSVRLILSWFAYVVTEKLIESINIFWDDPTLLSTSLKLFFEEHGSFTELLLYIPIILAALADNSMEKFVANFKKSSDTFILCQELTRKSTRGKEDPIFSVTKQYFDTFMNVWKSVLNGETPTVPFSRFYSRDFLFGPTGWHTDPYPNGVQDLTIKEELRTGGTMKLIETESVSKLFIWRANQALSCFQWRVEKEKSGNQENTQLVDFPNSIPISKIVCITKGLTSEYLKKASKKQRGLSHDNCLSIETAQTEDFPSGITLALRCTNKAERDKFVLWLAQWKEACTT